MQKILIIDDNLDTIHEFIESLDTNNFMVNFINKDFGNININQILTINPNIIIVDIDLSGNGDQDGFKIISMINKHNKTSHIPVIVLSFYNEKDIANKCEYSCFIAKPCDKEFIEEKIQECLI